MAKPNILLCGRFYPATIETCWLEWLQNNGYQVDTFDYEDVWHRVTAGSNLVKRIIWHTARDWMSNFVSRDLAKMAETRQPDLVLIVAGRMVNAECLERIKAHGGASVYHFYNEDLFNRLNTTETLRLAAPHYDHFFTTKSFNVSEMTALGINQVSYVPHGYRPNCHFPVTVNGEERQRLGSDLVFIGTWEEERAKVLAKLIDFDLRIWGGYWHRRHDGIPAAIIQKREIYCEDMSRVINASKICLAFLRKANRDQHTSRTFEIPACGGFQLSERTDEVLGFFEEGREIECFSTIAELRDKAAYYLVHENERKRVAQAGFERLHRSGYSFTDRLASILHFYAGY